ncbi:MAG: hypothetical protein ABJH63_12505 [Rhizobiaceae bacterium]
MTENTTSPARQERGRIIQVFLTDAMDVLAPEDHSSFLTFLYCNEFTPVGWNLLDNGLLLLSGLDGQGDAEPLLYCSETGATDSFQALKTELRTAQGRPYIGVSLGRFPVDAEPYTHFDTVDSVRHTDNRVFAVDFIAPFREGFGYSDHLSAAQDLISQLPEPFDKLGYVYTLSPLAGVQDANCLRVTLWGMSTTPLKRGQRGFIASILEPYGADPRSGDVDHVFLTAPLQMPEGQEPIIPAHSRGGFVFTEGKLPELNLSESGFERLLRQSTTR